MVADIAEGSHLREWRNLRFRVVARATEMTAFRVRSSSHLPNRDAPDPGIWVQVKSLPRSMGIFTVKVLKIQEPYKMKCGDSMWRGNLPTALLSVFGRESRPMCARGRPGKGLSRKIYKAVWTCSKAMFACPQKNIVDLSFAPISVFQIASQCLPLGTSLATAQCKCSQLTELSWRASLERMLCLHKSAILWLTLNSSLRVIGHNTGTSMDGVDLVHVHFTQDSPTSPLHMKLLHYGEYPMPKKLKERVMRLIKENATTPEELAIVNIQLGEVIADAVDWFAQKNNFSLETDVDLIGGQGQTIWHLPLPELFAGNQIRAHLDMAEIAIVAARTGVTSLGNFRVSDMALGRQGCPLFAALDSLLLNHPTLNRAVQNIGGIANFSILPRGAVEECYDFDTGPGNVFIDAAVRYFTDGKQEYDKDGAMGQKGRVDQSVVDKVLQGPYFTHDIPKTTGRETFGDRMAEDICDEMLASKCRFSNPDRDFGSTDKTVTSQAELPRRTVLPPSPESQPRPLPMPMTVGVHRGVWTKSTWAVVDRIIQTSSTT